MVRIRVSPRNLRIVRRFAVVLPFVPLFAAACGGSDYLPVDDSGADATPLEDGAMGADSSASDTGADAMIEDATLGDGGMKGDGGASEDAADASNRDAAHEDASDGAAEDGSRADASDATVEDASDASHPDASDGAPADDATADASDAAIADASDSAPMDASDSAIADASDSAPTDASDAPNDSGADFTDPLGSAVDFAVFGSSSVTNAGATIINGNLGSSSSTAIGPTAPVFGVGDGEHLGDLTATNALGDIKIAYNDLIKANLACGTDLTGQDLGGKTLAPGVYCFDTSAGLTGQLTLDAQNDPKAIWVFQIGSTLTINSNVPPSSVVVINQVNPLQSQVCNAYWQVGSAATILDHSLMGGNIIALSAVTVGVDATLVGRAFAWQGGVTLDANAISIDTCAPVAPLP